MIERTIDELLPLSQIIFIIGKIKQKSYPTGYIPIKSAILLINSGIGLW
jgi:hypothetical protein